MSDIRSKLLSGAETFSLVPVPSAFYELMARVHTRQWYIPYFLPLQDIFVDTHSIPHWHCQRKRQDRTSEGLLLCRNSRGESD